MFSQIHQMQSTLKRKTLSLIDHGERKVGFGHICTFLGSYVRQNAEVKRKAPLPKKKLTCLTSAQRPSLSHDQSLEANSLCGGPLTIARPTPWTDIHDNYIVILQQ